MKCKRSQNVSSTRVFLPWVSASCAELLNLSEAVITGASTECISQEVGKSKWFV